MLGAVRGVRQRLSGSMRAFASVGRNPNLRWLELSWAASVVGHYAFLIAVSVYAYDVGGARAVGLIFLARLIPAGLAAPFAGMLGDRYPRERVLLLSNVARIVLLSLAALAAFADSSPWIVYSLAIVITIASTPYRSAQAALTPNLAQTPEELTAANAVASGIESIAWFAGPALAGLLLAVASMGTVFAINALLIVVSTGFLLLMRIDDSERPHRELEASTIAAERIAGFTTLGRHPSLRVMVVLLGAQTALIGAQQVFIVVVALQLLDLGSGGVGYLNAAMGVGAFIGAIGSLSLTGARRLSPAFLFGVVLLGLPLVALGLWQSIAVAVLAFALMGAGSAVVDISGLTIVQRAVTEDVLARVFGVIQMVFYATLGLGAALAPVLISWLGDEAAMVVAGLFLPVLVLLFGRTVARIDAAAEIPDADELRLLGSVPIFAPLPGGSLEHIASRLVPLRVEPRSVVIREGDDGDRFYLVVEGTLTVTQDGTGLGTLGAGDVFGEIALLRNTARTATVTAQTAVVLYALDREDFLAAVTGHPQSAEAAETVMSARLAGPAATGYRSSVN